MTVQLALVAVGGALGSVSRYGIGLAAARYLGKGFPWGTLLVNVAGCFLMGIVVQLLLGLETQTPPLGQRPQLAFWRQGVAMGFLGGLTTFSSFGAETVRELAAHRPGIALLNIAANVVLSLVAVWCGILVAQSLD